jgi:hypothetical protein
MTSEQEPHEHSSNDPCNVCTWSPSRLLQPFFIYKSNVEVAYVSLNDACWHLGGKYLLKDRHIYSKNDADNHKFVQENTTIPVPNILASWTEPEDRYMMIEEVIEDADDTLGIVWSSLSESDRDNIARQVADYINQLRIKTSSKVQDINEGPVYWSGIFTARNNGELFGPFESEDEIFEAMTAHMKKNNLPEKVMAQLRKHMPPAKPYTFTHTRLHLGNIKLKGKKVVGITDWDSAAYLPCWQEYLMARYPPPGLNSSEADEEWAEYLYPKLDQYKDAMDWFYLVENLRTYPDLDEKGWELLKKVEAVADYDAEQESTESAAGGL